MPIEILTIGHSNLPIERFIELLQDNGLDVLVDVRSTPYSRYNPQFTCACATGAGNRESLATSLVEAGIEYTFAGEYLGGRPRDPTCYKSGEVPGEGADYLKLVDYQEIMRRPWYQQGIARLIEMAAGPYLAIMCSEEDPLKCHRHHLIAQTLLEQGIIVLHIRSDGRVQDASELEKEEKEEPLQLTLPLWCFADLVI
jgi:uncharacterized protein (DUF488 family)